MSVEIKIPTVGESITEVTVGTWLKADGAYVELDESICELESEKASFELNAEIDGILRHKASEGDTLKIGEVICLIEPNGGADKKTPPSREKILLAEYRKRRNPATATQDGDQLSKTGRITGYECSRSR